MGSHTALFTAHLVRGRDTLINTQAFKHFADIHSQVSLFLPAHWERKDTDTTPESRYTTLFSAALSTNVSAATNNQAAPNLSIKTFKGNIINRFQLAESEILRAQTESESYERLEYKEQLIDTFPGIVYLCSYLRPLDDGQVREYFELCAIVESPDITAVIRGTTPAEIAEDEIKIFNACFATMRIISPKDSSTPSVFNNEAENLSYYHKILGLSLHAPTGWLGIKEDEFPLVIVAPEEEDYTSSICIKSNAQKIQSQEEFEAFIQSMYFVDGGPQIPDYAFMGGTFTTIEGTHAYIANYSWTSPEAGNRTLINVDAWFWNEEQDGLTEVHCYALASLAEKYIPAFSGVVSSLRHIPG